MPARDRPVMAFGPVEASAENREIGCRSGRPTRGRADPRRHFGRHGNAGGPPSPDRGDQGIWRPHPTHRQADRTETGRQLWAHRADGLLRDETATSEHLAVRIAAALQPCLRLAEIDHALRKPTVCLGAYDLALRAMPGVLSLDASGNGRALELLDRALQIEPDHPLATALAAWAHVQRVVYHFTTEAAQERARSLALVHKARTLCSDATVLAILGNALSLLDEFDAADLVIAQGADDRRRLGLGVEPQRMDRRLQGRSAIRHRALQDRARPRTARSTGVQQHGRDRLRAVHQPANTPKARAGRSGRWRNILPQAGCIGRCVRPMCWRVRRRQAQPQPRRIAASIIPT